MSPARRAPVDTDETTSALTVHPHWRRRIAGVGGPAVCDIRPATLAAIADAAALLRRAGCGDAAQRHADGSSLLLLAWADPDRLPADGPAPGAVPGRAPGSGPHTRDPRFWTREPPRLWVAGCVEIDWSGPLDAEVRRAAGDCVELRALWVQNPARGRGVGRALVAAAEEACLAIGRPRVVAALPAGPPGTAGRHGNGGESGRPLAAAISAGYTALTPLRPSGGAAAGVEDEWTAGRFWVCKDVPDTAAADRRRARVAARMAARAAAAGQR